VEELVSDPVTGSSLTEASDIGVNIVDVGVVAVDCGTFSLSKTGLDLISTGVAVDEDGKDAGR
jgi:hypothetical protein